MALRKTARLYLLVVASTVAFLGILCYTDNVDQYEHHHLSRRRKLSTETTPTTQEFQSEPDDSNNASSSAAAEGYTYLIIHYHKSGHDLTQALRDIIITHDPTITRNYIDRFPRREHDTTTKCPRLYLHPNTVYVQASPDFFCDIDVLAEELLLHPTKRSVKIIHLIRDPFSMAISNYMYHSQDPLPEGESWVKRTNPCLVEEKSSVVYANLFMQTFTSPGSYRIMEYEDFPIISQMCHEVYSKVSDSPGFYTHLRTLSPTDGLLLATTYLMLGHGGDLLRMANNIIKLRQLQLLEKQIQIHQHTLHTQSQYHHNNGKHHRGDMVYKGPATSGTTTTDSMRIQVLTLSMDNFISQPKQTILQFLNFVFDTSLSDEMKEEIAFGYEKMYYKKVNEGDEHITSLVVNGGVFKSNGTDAAAPAATSEEKKKTDMTELEQSLRENVLFGRVMGNIKNMVDEALRGVHNWY
jgi:hypothetical protein